MPTITVWIWTGNDSQSTTCDQTLLATEMA